MGYRLVTCVTNSVTSAARSAARLATLPLLLAGFLAATPVSAATTTFDTLLDVDNSLATGCSVNTSNGVFGGVDKILQTVVVTDATGYRTQSIALRQCLGGNVLSAPVAIDNALTPIARGFGTGGTSAVETYIPFLLLPPSGNKMRVAVTATGADGLTGDDALTDAATHLF